MKLDPKRGRPPAVALAVLGGFLMLSAAPAAAADDEPMVTDRPDQTESASIVPKGALQLELGALHTRDGNGIERETTQVPASLLRFGLRERLELRLGWAGFVDERLRTRSASASASGTGGADLGFKLLLAEEGPGRRPQTALLASTTLAVGSEGFSSDRFDPSVRLAMSSTLGDRLSVGYNGGLTLTSRERPGRGVTTLTSALYTVSLAIDLDGPASVFVELFGTIPVSDPGPESHSFDAGLTWLARPRLQLDVAGGVGLSEEAADWFVGIGVSTRFPH